MARPVTLLVVFFLALNLLGGVFIAQDVDDFLGINAELGEDEETEKLQEKIGDSDNQDEDGLPTGSPSDGTLFGLYNVIGGFLSGLYGYIFPGLQMLNRAGVPSYLTNMMGTIFGLLIVIDIAAFVRGYEI